MTSGRGGARAAPTRTLPGTPGRYTCASRASASLLGSSGLDRFDPHVRNRSRTGTLRAPSCDEKSIQGRNLILGSSRRERIRGLRSRRPTAWRRRSFQPSNTGTGYPTRAKTTVTRLIAPPAATRQLATADAPASSSSLVRGLKLTSPDSSRARNCSERRRGRVSGAPSNDDRGVRVSGVAYGRSSTERSAGCGVSWRSSGMGRYGCVVKGFGSCAPLSAPGGEEFYSLPGT